MTLSPNRKVDRIIAAFRSEKPAFKVDRDRDVFEFEGRVGVRARNKAACIPVDGRENKKAYYVEGTPYQMGYLLGWMAEPDVARMCTEFPERVVFEFIHLDMWPWLEDRVGKTLEVLLYLLSANIYPDVPDEYKQELEGILAGCRGANPHTQVNWADLWVLNVGIDALLSYVYTGGMPVGVDRRLPHVITHKHLRVPFMCNAFSVFGPHVEDNGGSLTLEAAKEIINFLTPDPVHGKFPDYYNPPKRRCRRLFRGRRDDSDDWKYIPIKGAVSLMDLKNRTIHSHYGYYGDGWVQIHLEKYIAGSSAGSFPSPPRDE